MIDIKAGGVMSFIRELKRRNVFRVGIAYLVVAWLTLQISDVLISLLKVPEIIGRGVVLLLVVGFPLAVILAWAFELTPEGIQRDKDVDQSATARRPSHRKLDLVIIVSLVLALGFVAVDQYVLEEQRGNAVLSADAEKAIAVLPFVNRSALEEDAYFVDGIHDDILTQLHKLSGLDKVISRTTMEQYRDTKKSMPEIARELGVSTILEGGVQKVGDNIRVTVQLIDASNDEHLWAENYDRKLDTENIFAIQSEIATAIANALQATLTPDEVIGLAELPTDNLQAYDHFLLGRQGIARLTLDTLQEAVIHFEAAIELDPQFALAFVGKADAVSLMAGFGGAQNQAERDTLLNTAEQAAQQALALDPQLGHAYTTLGYVAWRRQDYDTAEAHLIKALRLAPGYSEAFGRYAHVLWDTGREDQALQMARRGHLLDPMSPTANVVLGIAFDINGQSEEALASFDRALDIDPDFDFALSRLYEFYSTHGDLGQAVEVYRRLYALNPTVDDFALELMYLYEDLGADQEFAYWRDRALPSQSDESARDDSMRSLALAGRNDEALPMALELLDEGSYCTTCWFIVRNEMQSDPEAVLQLFNKYRGELDISGQQKITRKNTSLAPVAIWALRETGAIDQADALEKTVLDIAQNHPRRAVFGFYIDIEDVKIHAYRGRKQEALAAMRLAVDAGWR
ncbi:MAG: TolB-like protein/Tfp pilus assembly protein PilF, partial [Woeseiaceae bacterium]